MALSNKFGWLVLTTGNKSELSAGYFTLYGDSVGGFAVIKDIPKTLVYDLARWRNKRDKRPVIPESTITRAPTAELRRHQKDQDTLPPYDILDAIIAHHVEENHGLAEIVKDGIEPGVAAKTLRTIDAMEYKRRQAPLGVKITPRAFGRDRRMPITNRFRPYDS
jgi:NAD+ synthase (glutamine-hydrolysing)